MAALSAEIRSTFERTIVKARAEAEAAARAALTSLAVERDKPFDSMAEPQRALRRALRARARQLGEGGLPAGLPLLVEEIAYEQWHRMLFARFLAENHLLMHPQGVAVTLAECAELAKEERAEDLWAVATGYAAAMLPGIFRVDDPALQVRFAPEGRHRLEQLLAGLPRAVFTSDDGLGWSYQFWQSARKKEVNASERKIGGADIAPVTQLFTEDYMVRFLLHNTLGAWWAARHPDSPLNKSFDYLRTKDDGTPAAGTFDGWPANVAEVTMIDPCGGSGHFVVAAFEMLARMRMEAEGLDARAAGDAVIRDNIHMLEIDPRCTQIAAFNLALAAWKLGGYRQLPAASIACSGIPVAGQLEDWLKLAGGDANLRRGLERLYELFRHAPDLGSLIDPAAAFANDPLFAVDFDALAPLLRRALAGKHGDAGPDAPLYEAAVLEAARAAELLAGKYTLVATNVPYLGRGKHNSFLVEYADRHFPSSKADLATMFIQRCISYVVSFGATALVTPQSWLFLNSYRLLRAELLKKVSWELAAKLGPGAFETISGEVVQALLLILINEIPKDDHSITTLDVSTARQATDKAAALIESPITGLSQEKQLLNPDNRIVLGALVDAPLIGDYALSLHGQGSFDSSCFTFGHWEIPRPQAAKAGWIFQQTTSNSDNLYSGCTNIFRWEEGKGLLAKYMQAMAQNGYSSGKWKAGIPAWGKQGVAISGMTKLHFSLYAGHSYDENVAVIVPHDQSLVAAFWCYCMSGEFERNVRMIDQNLKVSCNTFLKVPFEKERWEQVAGSATPLPEPFTNEPASWLFKGHPVDSTDPLQVAVARLLGYRWPEQPESDGLDAYADGDGIVCLPAVGGEEAAHVRLAGLLAAAYGEAWSPARQAALLADAGYAGKTLAEWLRDGFFAQHCRLFHNRPFIWHVWDGRKDGFSALLNYHKLDYARLERLIYTTLGDWIIAQRAAAERGAAGADGRLVAALALQKKLELILAGEPPHDIYVRWKPLHEQPLGWRPDLNDGVRLNIRPWVTAGVLRAKFTINWNKDRGKNPDGSERLNDLHFKRAEKEAARRAAGGQRAE